MCRPRRGKKDRARNLETIFEKVKNNIPVNDQKHEMSISPLLSNFCDKRVYHCQTANGPES